MRKLKYISPTSYSMWKKDRTAFYLRYCADNPAPREPQTQPMAVGTAFDAYVKEHIVKNLKGHLPPEFEAAHILNHHVEPQVRDWAIDHGKRIFDFYCSCGALANLMLELQCALHEPRFEFQIEGRVSHSCAVGEVPILGKPDVYFVTKGANHVILDWKVNGYCSKWPTSPAPGYVRLLPGGKTHKDAQLMVIDGIVVNIACALEDDYAVQTCMYAWTLGEDVGSPFIVGIEQLVGQQGNQRVASHRTRIGKDFQIALFKDLVLMWTSLEQGHVFTDMPISESKAKCAALDKVFSKSNDPQMVAYQKLMGICPKG